MMGDRSYGHGIHRVSVPDFAIGRYEVTFDEWEACVRGGGCRSNPTPDDKGWGRGRRPVINVSWNDAQEYVQWLSQRTGQRYRLPTEAEWDYADHGPRDYLLSRGLVRASQNDVPPMERQTVEVGTVAPNYFGIHDKTGNVSELVEDSWHETFEGAPGDGSAWVDGAEKVYRGLNWFDGDSWHYYRASTTADFRDELVGFRVARALRGVRNPDPLPTPFSGPPEPPTENGYYIHGESGDCGQEKGPVTLAGDVALHASRVLPSPVIATVRRGETVRITDCRVHFRPVRGVPVRTDYGFEVGQPVYLIYNNRNEWDSEYFESTDVIEYVWNHGEMVPYTYDYPPDLIEWATLGPGTVVQPYDGAGGGCWYELEARGVRGWGQSADLACYWRDMEPTGD